MFEIVQPGLLSTLQDTGRRGMRHLGIPWAGVMVPAWQQVANTLAGNAQSDTIIECYEGGFQGIFHKPSRLAIAADASATMTLIIDEVETKCQPFRSYDVSNGTKLFIKSTGQFRLAVIALNGLETKEQFGSTATYTKAALGGINGRALANGDELYVSAALNSPLLKCEQPTIPGIDNGVLHAVAGPQDHHFSDQGLKDFFSSEFVLTPEVDRMGARLQGPRIEHINSSARDIVSDAILPGSVQIPGNGQPIVLLADAHTAGGYPKIATLASADLSALSLARPGSQFRFKQLTTNEAVDYTRSCSADLQRVMSKLDVLTTTFDTSSLLSNNLIDGVTDGSN